MTDKKRFGSKVSKNQTGEEKKSRKNGNVFFSGLKNFGIVFASCLVIFGLLASFAVAFVTSAVSDIFKDEKDQLGDILKGNESTVPVSGDDSDVPEGESFTALVVVTDFDFDHYHYYPEGAELSKLRENYLDRTMGILGKGYKTVNSKMISLIRCDKDRREYTVTPISTHTRVFTSSGYKMLSEVCEDFGPEYMVKKIEAITGFHVDYYFFLNAAEAPEVMSSLGSFTVELPTDIYSDGATYGTLYRTYESVTSAVPPETTAPETEAVTADEETAKAPETEEAVTEPETEEVAKDEDEKTPRHGYTLAVQSGTVAVTGSNIQALLMYDDYESGIDERLELEYQLVKGAMTRLASLSEEELAKFYSENFRETPYEDFPTVRADKAAPISTPEDGEDKEKDKDKEKKTHGYLDDTKVNTDMSTKSFEAKYELISAFLRFNVKRLDLSGRFVNGYFAPNLTESTTIFSEYKLPTDPERIVTPKQTADQNG